MPALIELPNLPECAKLCRDLGLRFLELNMNLPQFQCDKFDCEVFKRIARDYGIYYIEHSDFKYAFVTRSLFYASRQKSIFVSKIYGTIP